QQQASMIGIRRRLEEDLYINFSGLSPDNTKAIFQMYVFPLVSWIWIGYWVLLFGTIICLIPGKVRLQYARTEVVGIATTPAPVDSYPSRPVPDSHCRPRGARSNVVPPPSRDGCRRQARLPLRRLPQHGRKLSDAALRFGRSHATAHTQYASQGNGR